MFSFDPADHDIEAVLTRLGRSFVKFFCRPGAMSPLRTVISISERMPEIGKKFYETGPAKGVAAFHRYLESQVAAGNLMIEDCEVAAAQFLDSCHATISDRCFSMPAMHLPMSVSTTWSALRSARSWRLTGVAPDPTDGRGLLSRNDEQWAKIEKVRCPKLNPIAIFPIARNNSIDKDTTQNQ